MNRIQSGEVCRHCGAAIYNDSDSNPVDPAGPWLDMVTTDDLCLDAPDNAHAPARNGRDL